MLARRRGGGGAATRRPAVSDGTGKRALANELLTLAGPGCEGLVGVCRDRPDLRLSDIYILAPRWVVAYSRGTALQPWLAACAGCSVGRTRLQPLLHTAAGGRRQPLRAAHGETRPGHLWLRVRLHGANERRSGRRGAADLDSSGRPRAKVPRPAACAGRPPRVAPGACPKCPSWYFSAAAHYLSFLSRR